MLFRTVMQFGDSFLYNFSIIKNLSLKYLNAFVYFLLSEYIRPILLRVSANQDIFDRM